jgi:hypothetical protein
MPLPLSFKASIHILSWDKAKVSGAVVLIKEAVFRLDGDFIRNP